MEQGTRRLKASTYLDHRWNCDLGLWLCHKCWFHSFSGWIKRPIDILAIFRPLRYCIRVGRYTHQEIQKSYTMEAWEGEERHLKLWGTPFLEILAPPLFFLNSRYTSQPIISWFGKLTPKILYCTTWVNLTYSFTIRRSNSSEATVPLEMML